MIGDHPLCDRTSMASDPLKLPRGYEFKTIPIAGGAKAFMPRGPESPTLNTFVTSELTII